VVFAIPKGGLGYRFSLDGFAARTVYRQWVTFGNITNNVTFNDETGIVTVQPYLSTIDLQG